MKSLPIIVFTLFSALSALAQSPLEKAKKLFDENKTNDAAKILETITSGTDYAAAQYFLGRIAIRENRLEDAQTYFEKAVKENDRVADYHTWLGNAYGQIARDANMFKQGMLAPKMKAEWEKAVTLDPSSIEPRQSLVQYYLQAPGFMGGSVDKAFETAKQIMALNPAEGHLQMGNIYVHEKKTEEAQKEFIEMVRINSAYIGGLANFYVQQKQYDKAFSLFEEAVKKNPEDMGSFYQIGKTSAVSGQRLERGEECLKKYLGYTPKKNEPSLAGANMRLGQITEKKGDKAGAKNYYEVALKMDGSLKDAKEGLARVK